MEKGIRNGTRRSLKFELKIFERAIAGSTIPDILRADQVYLI